jgi:AcrR family transcriptional regulator
MRVKDESDARSVASTARRTQIVAATVEVIAQEGFAQTSFARIAERAGLSSTRLISYHFASKAELIAAVVGEVIGAMGEYVGGRIDLAEQMAPGSATDILRAYIEGTVGFIATNRTQMQALLRIVVSSGMPGADSPSPQATAAPLEGLLRHGQSTGEFRSFDAATVASAIQRAIEALPFLLQAQPDLDCDRYAAELVELYLRGVREDAA